MRVIRSRLAVLAAAALMISGATFAANSADVVVVANGGPPQDAHRKALWEPAAKALGLTFEEDTSQSWTEAKAQVDSGSVTWDIISLNMGEVQLAVDAGVLVKLPEDIVDRKDFAPGAVSDYCIGNTMFSQVMGYNTAKYGENGPKNMTDFFDEKKFPGKRAVYRSPRGNLESAALALGQPQGDIYKFLATEEGRKAAFAKLAELKANAIWWDSGSQLTQLIKDGQVDMAFGWDGRIITAIDEGAPFKVVYQDGILNVDCYAVVKGGPHTDNAIKFLKEISKAEYVKDLVKYVAYGGANLKAYDGYDEKTLSRLTSAPANIAGQYPADVDFWGKNGTTLSEEFDAMLLAN